MLVLENEELTDQLKDVQSFISDVIDSCNQLTAQVKEGRTIEISNKIKSLDAKCTSCFQEIQ